MSLFRCENIPGRGKGRTKGGDDKNSGVQEKNAITEVSGAFNIYQDQPVQKQKGESTPESGLWPLF